MASIARVLIVGGGIAGQTLAVALARRGIFCETVEIKPDFQIVGAGMYVQGNALRALREIGVVEAIVERGWHPADDRFFTADVNGARLAHSRVPRIAGPELPATVTIRRRVLHDILQEAVGRTGVRVRMGATVAAIDDDPAAAGVAVRFSDGTADIFDLVVGADGIRSSVRTMLFGRSDPVFTGYANWRVTLPKPADLDAITWMMGRGKSLGIIPIAADHLYLAGVTKEPGNPRYDRAELPRLMREKFAEFGGAAPALLVQVQRPEQVVYTAIEEVTQPAPWHRGRVVLVGDAVHASAPFWAQGASMAIEDVIVLAELIATGRPAEDILPQWMARRYDRAVWVQQGSLETGERGHREGPGVYEAITAYLAANMPKEVAARFAKFAEPI
ncbi:MAG: monooxygenase [Rhodospirillales bacterium]|nr:monooxygenase [Rhodospirillales bacterium]